MIKYILPSVIALTVLASCSDSKKERTSIINEKKVQLEKLKNENQATNDEILALEAELAKLDTGSVNPAKTKLVSIAPVVREDFNHYIELQGRVDADNISYIAPRGMGGQVKAIYVKQGDRVRKGQLLLKLDNAVQQQQVVAARQQAGGIKSQLALAKTLYQRQKNLWDQGIGTEVQLLNSQTNVATLESQLQQVNEQVKLAQEQLNTANVYSDVSGVADVVNVRVGEIFQGMTAAGPQIKIVNTSDLKVVSTIPENYLGTVQVGSPVIIDLPDINKTYNSKVSFTGASIDNINRGFVVEAKLPGDVSVKPNQIANLRIKDYASANAISIPLNTLQNDQNGKFVMIAREEKGNLVARKRTVTEGRINGDKIEIISGLQPGDQIVTEGYTGIYDGQYLTTTVK